MPATTSAAETASAACGEIKATSTAVISGPVTNDTSIITESSAKAPRKSSGSPSIISGQRDLRTEPEGG